MLRRKDRATTTKAQFGRATFLKHVQSRPTARAELRMLAGGIGLEFTVAHGRHKHFEQHLSAFIRNIDFNA